MVGGPASSLQTINFRYQCDVGAGATLRAAQPNQRGLGKQRGLFMSKIVSFFKDESGASAAEYALILAIVGIGIVVAAQGLRDQIAGAMDRAARDRKSVV